jgi:hypothetical protein
MEIERYRGHVIAARPKPMAGGRGWTQSGIIETRSGDILVKRRVYRPRRACRTLDEAIARSISHAKRLIDRELADG